MKYFNSIETAPPDFILGLSAAYKAEPRPEKVNLGAGVYKTDSLQPYVLKSVKAAESILLNTEKDKEYLPIDGDPVFIEELKKLVFGDTIDLRLIYGLQAVGGTGALRVGAQFLKNFLPAKVCLSDPTWVNHRQIFTHVGFELETYPYFDSTGRCLNFSAMMAKLHTLDEYSTVLLQGACHNPTGFDPSPDQWKEIAELMKKRHLIPFFDLAYQGFGDGIEEDTASIRHFVSLGLTMLVATSYSKNFGLYAERVGALFIVCQSQEEAERLGSQARIIIRGLYSNPPAHGMRIVRTILETPDLTALWKQELEQMRKRIDQMRQNLADSLDVEKFAFLRTQKGMFSYTGLSPTQVQQLTDEFAIYLPKDGRINVAGLNADNIAYVAHAIGTVCKHA